MAAEDELRRLIGEKTETRSVDFKERFNWAEAKRAAKLAIIKDILAMANSEDGGTIVFGVRDQDRMVVGLSEGDFNSFDETRIHDLAREYGQPSCAFRIVRGEMEGKRIIGIMVAEFEEDPILCKKDYHDAESNQQILRQGALYVRTNGARTEEVRTVEDMRRLLGRAMLKKRDSLLSAIEGMIKGRPTRPTEDSQSKFEIERREAEKYLESKIGAELRTAGHWVLAAYPAEYGENASLEQVKDALRKTQVKLRGWYFPHFDRDNEGYFNQGFQSFTNAGEFLEGFRAYQSGLFFFKSALWEEEKGKEKFGRAVIDVISMIYTLTEFFFFVDRFFGELKYEGTVVWSVELQKSDGRLLVGADPGLPGLWGNEIAKDDPLRVQGRTPKANLYAGGLEVSRGVIMRLLRLFNCGISESIVSHWQERLIRRRF